MENEDNYIKTLVKSYLTRSKITSTEVQEFCNNQEKAKSLHANKEVITR